MANSCKEIWARFGCGPEGFRRISEAFSDCECEGCSASPHSPGPVSGNETLVRKHFIPVHFCEEDGKCTHDAYADVYRRGLSVNRKRHTTGEEIIRRAEQAVSESMRQGKSTKVDYVLATSKWRNLSNYRFSDGSRFFCVYDTATEHDHSHADVVRARFHDKLSRGAKMAILDALAESFEIEEIEDIFPDQAP